MTITETPKTRQCKTEHDCPQCHQHLRAKQYGSDTNINLECDNCGYQTVIESDLNLKIKY